jgi:hypothetical protein
MYPVAKGVRRLIAGYRTIGGFVLSVFAISVIALLAATTITLPVWYLAAHNRFLFNGLLLVGCAAAGFGIIRHRRGSVRVEARVRRRRRISITLAIVFAAASLISMLATFSVVSIAATILATIGLGWVFGYSER